MMSFMTLGIFWVGQQTQLNHLERSSRSLTWIHLAFLFLVTVVPFSTALLAEHIRYRLALVLYWANITLAGLGPLLELGVRGGERAGEVRHSDGSVGGNQAANRRRAVSVCTGRDTLRGEQLPEHRIHRAGAIAARDCAAVGNQGLRPESEISAGDRDADQPEMTLGHG